MVDEPRASFAFVRSALLPLESWFAEGAAREDRGVVRPRLRRIVEQPMVREALLLASPSLDEHVTAWLNGPSDVEAPKLERALSRYVVRMTTRPTPFGLFAGGSFARIANRTALTLAPPAAYRRRTRIDAERLRRGLERVVASPGVADTIPLIPNATVRRAGSALRYIRVDRDEHWSFVLVEIEDTEALELALTAARGRPCRPALVGLLARELAVSPEEAAAFVDDLVEQQLLQRDLPLGHVGDDPLRAIIDSIGRAVCGDLVAADEDARAIDRASTGEAYELHRQLRTTVHRLDPDGGDSPFAHGELFKPGQLSLSHSVAREICRAAELLQRIGVVHRPAALHRFKRDLLERFAGASVPLLQALDEDLGPGFDPAYGGGIEASALLEDLPLAPAQRPEATFAARDAHLLARIQECVRRGERILVLDDDDFAALESRDRMPLPPSFGVMCTLLARSAEAIDDGDYEIALDYNLGLSPLGMIARFSGLDPDLTAAIADHARLEQTLNADHELAEVVHVPDGAIANVLWRPRLRDAEIEVLARGDDGERRRLSLAELRVSVEGDRVVLRVPDCSRPILPVMTTAHEVQTRRSAGLYRFLRALTQQDQKIAHWSWGPLAAAPFLPRVVAGRVILARARWRLTGPTLEPLRGKTGDDCVSAFRRLRAELALPRHVVCSEYDRELAVDFDDALSVESFAHWVGRRGEVIVFERLATLERACLEGPDGHFVHELIVPFTNAAMQASRPVGRASGLEPAPVAHPPGGDWLYLKLYTGEAHADTLLTTMIAPLVASARAAGIAERWFFVRYADPDFHLRLRIQGPRHRLLRELLPILCEQLGRAVTSGEASRIQLDTYVPELRRYGGARAMAHVEAIFHADSEAVTALLPWLDEGPAELRWQAALLGIDSLVRDLGLGGQGATLFRELADGFLTGFDDRTRLARAVGRKYRTLRDDVERIVTAGEDAPALRSVRELFARRSQRTRDASAALVALADAQQLTAGLEGIAAALVHMHVNRIISLAAREHEYVLYELLARCHESQRARRR